MKKLLYLIPLLLLSSCYSYESSRIASIKKLGFKVIASVENYGDEPFGCKETFIAVNNAGEIYVFKMNDEEIILLTYIKDIVVKEGWKTAEEIMEEEEKLLEEFNKFKEEKENCKE